MNQKSREEKIVDASTAMRRLLHERHLIDIPQNVLRIGEREYDPELVLSTLDSVVGTKRRARIDSVIAGRTFNIATVVEGLANVGNAAAVMRTAEAFGFQPFHVIAGEAPLKQSDRTTQGADKWLDVHVWGDAESCVKQLKADGYRIVATCLDPKAKPFDLVDLSQRTALVLGNELSGITEEMKELADDLAIIEMPGFVESFNISVAAAIALYEAHRQRIRAFGSSGDLRPPVEVLLRASFFARSTRHAVDLLEAARRS